VLLAVFIFYISFLLVRLVLIELRYPLLLLFITSYLYLIRYSDQVLKWMTVESGFDSRHGLPYSFETIPGVLPGSYSVGIGGAFPGGQSGRGVKVTIYLVRAVAQAISRWLPTAVPRVRVRAACGIRGGQSGTGAGFLRELRFSLPIIPPISPSS
jgi:hypothetical protein